MRIGNSGTVSNMIDYKTTFDNIVNNTTAEIQKIFPIEGRVNRLELDGVEVQPNSLTLDDEYNAKFQGKTLSVPVTARMKLVNKDTGALIDERRMPMMKLPVYTRRGTFIVGGNEYNVTLQNRRLPGIYPIKRDTGEVEAEFNVAKGASQHMNMLIDPAHNQFKMKFGSSSTKPLYPLLRAVGITDEQIANEWGADVLLANKSKTRGGDDRHIMDIAKRLTGKDHTDVLSASEAVRNQFALMQLDKNVSKATLGEEYETIQPDVLLKTSRRILDINRGQAEPVDRNALYFKSIMGVEDFIPERIQGQVKSLKRRLMMKTDREQQISKIMPSGFLTGPVEQLFTKTSLSEISNQYNPVDIMSSAAKITALGEGGISKIETVRDEMRALNHSHAGFFDPIHTPESEKIGVSLHLAAGAVKRGQKLYMKVMNPVTKQLEEIDHQMVGSKTMALPGQSWNPKTMTFSGQTVRAIRGNKMIEVPVNEVDYVLPSPQSMFGMATNMVPMLNSNSGARVFMASKQMTQALNLKNREIPLVQTGKAGQSFEKIVGQSAVGATAPFDGRVVDVTDDYITVQSGEGKNENIPLYRNFPMNNGHFINTDKVHVKPGDAVVAGQPLIDNNFTKDGHLAMGLNLRTAYMSDGGYNFEDGITISRSAADKMKSEHLHINDFRNEERIDINPRKFQAMFPNKFNRDILGKLGDDGIVKPGMIVNPGEPMVIALRKADMDMANQTLASIGKKLKQPWRDASMYYNEATPGVVDRVIKTAKGYKILVKSEEGAVIADKFSGRHGNKGVITRILPDEEMPKDGKGVPFEILLNPTGVPSRINPSQLLETALGKVANKTGKPIVMEAFTGEDMQNKVASLLQRNGFNPDGTEEVFDPTGKSLGKILTGYQYTLKLSKQAKTGFSARAAGAGEKYNIDQQPDKGGEDGSKAMDILSVYAMLAHGATANLREMSTDKSTNNPEFWRLLRNGLQLPAPKTTFAYDKFISYLRASGVNIDRKGAYLDMTPLTDTDIDKLSSGEITKAKFLQAKTLEPIKGGFSDKIITGGLSGTKWGHITMAEPIVNPLFANGLRAVLGITEAQMNDTIKTKGTKALQMQLAATDMAALEADLTDKLKTTTSPQLVDKLNQRLHYVQAVKKFGDPQKAYFLTKYPVIPSNLRPINQQEDGNQTVAQVNFLYRDLLLMNNSLKDVQKIPYVPESVKGELREALQNSVQAVAGLNDPLGRYPKERTPKGFVEQIKGAKAKEGFFQRKVLRKTQDVTGRGVITPDPKLGVDEVGLPEDMAWKIYEPFIERRLRQQGYQYNDIMTMITNKDVRALPALKAEMNERPVMLNRPPSLHKFSFLSFKPHLTNGMTIQIPSLVTKGFNADFDGDALMVHVPVRPEAVAESRNKMMASHNLFNPRSDEPIVVPTKEAVLGIWRASQSKAGMDELKKIVPIEYHDMIKPEMSSGDIGKLLTRVGVENPNIYTGVVKNIKDFGDEMAYRTGFTLNLRDLSINDPEIEKIRSGIYQQTKRFANNPTMMNKVLHEYDVQLEDIIKKHKENNFVQMAVSKSSGGIGQIKQILGMPVQYTDESKRPIPIPITSTFGKGMGMNDYWTSLFAARRGMIDRKMETADPGAFAKELLINTTKLVANDNAVLDDEGEEFDVGDSDTLNRFLAKPVMGRDGKVVAQAGDAVTPKMMSRLKTAGANKMSIHTILSAPSDEGINPRSFGLFVEGRLPESGLNLGALAGQAMAEPLQQGAMKTFHTGGAVGSDTGSEVKGYDVVKALISLPEVIPNSAALSTRAGKVDKIEANPTGGTNIFIDGVKHFAGPSVKVKVKSGDVVKPGETLSSGIVNPRELLETTNDMGLTRRYMVDALRENYNVTGTPINRRILEVIVKSLTDTAEVDDPGDTTFLRGDVISYDFIQRHNNAKPFVASVNADIDGKLLAKSVGGYKVGTELTQDILEDLEEQKINAVEVKNKPVEYKPFIRGSRVLPQITGDLFTNLGYGYMQKALTERPAQGERIPIHSQNPIPAYAYGAEFGKGEKPGTY